MALQEQQLPPPQRQGPPTEQWVIKLALSCEEFNQKNSKQYFCKQCGVLMVHEDELADHCDQDHEIVKVCRRLDNEVVVLRASTPPASPDNFEDLYSFHDETKGSAADGAYYCVFLNPRSIRDPPDHHQPLAKADQFHCNTCQRPLITTNAFKYCSLKCKFHQFFHATEARDEEGTGPGAAGDYSGPQKNAGKAAGSSSTSSGVVLLSRKRGRKSYKPVRSYRS
ncbi:hypothetical protein Dimus_017076 [Dionaea muscipula]